MPGIIIIVLLVLFTAGDPRYDVNNYLGNLLTFKWWWIPLGLFIFVPGFLGRCLYFLTDTLPDFVIARFFKRK